MGAAIAGLYDVLCHSGAGITSLQASRIRRVRYGDTTIAVDSADEVGLVLNLTETHHARPFAEGRFTAAQPRVGAVTILPPGRPTTLLLDGTATVLFLQLPWVDLCDGAKEHGLDPGRIELQPRLAFLDPVLAHWLYAAGGGVEDEGEAIRVIVERLLQAHAGRGSRSGPVRRGGLSPVRLRRVQDRIEAELDQPVTLADLAGEAGVSVFHFAREFRRMTGLPPHRYILQRRLGRAIALLADARLSVAEVAAAAGFSDASHLARHLRHAAGMAPDAFRSRILL